MLSGETHVASSLRLEARENQREGIVKLTCCKEYRTYSPNGDTISCTHDVLPNLKRLSPQQTVIDRLHQVVAQAK